MLLYAPIASALELRKANDGSQIISGRFPYDSTAVLSDGGRNGGRPRKERFHARAFEYSVNSSTQEVFLLFGHDFDKPLASKLSKSLKLVDTDAALSFEATVAPAVAETSHGRDALALIGAGLAVGLSPGFRIPPQRTVPNAEKIEDEDPKEGNAIIRTIFEAILYELSIVSRPAYEQTQVEARNWKPEGSDRREALRRFYALA